MLSFNDAERRKLAEIVVGRCFRGRVFARGLAAVRRESPAKREEPMPHRVLVVDDEANILLSLEFLMKKAGYDVCTARDGEEALAEMRKARPDLVLLDVMMPKRNGFDVCETIRANPEWKDVRVIMLTAKARHVEREKGLAVGADDYITKPFSTREVVERVSEWLDRAGH
jgi:two-component system alkaline phosphatase synthesis response regulator PhoP